MSFELLDRAAARWDELVAAESASEDGLADLRRRLVARGLDAAGRPLCSVLRPHLLTEEQLAHQARVADQVCSAAAKVRDALVADEGLRRAHLGPFREWMGALLELDGRPVGEGALTRLDASLARTRLHFIELNADTPIGAGHHDAILDFFAGLDGFERFSAEYGVRALRLVPRLLATLLEVWSEWGAGGEPAITVITRTDDPLRVSSLEVDVEAYRRKGIDAEIRDFRELSYERGQLRAGDREIALVHRVMPTAECLEHRTELGALLAAERDGAICMVNPFRSELLGHKAIFALMTDPAHDFGFDAAERAAIREHVPWARLLADGRTAGPDGSAVDLVEHVLANRDRLVLKPAHQFGGKGVRLGWRESKEDWRRSVELGLEGDFIVQARIELHRREYPTIDAPGARRSFYEDTDPFILRGEMGGMLTRLSEDEITNVHVDGSLTASLAIEPRD